MGAAVCCPCGRQGDTGQPLQSGQQMTQQMSVAERIKVLNARPSTMDPNLGDQVRNAPTQAPKPTPSVARQIGGEPPSHRPAGAAQTTDQRSPEHAAKSSHAVVQIFERTTMYTSTQTPSPQRQEKSSPSQAAPQSIELKLTAPANPTGGRHRPDPGQAEGLQVQRSTSNHRPQPILRHLHRQRYRRVQGKPDCRCLQTTLASSSQKHQHLWLSRDLHWTMKSYSGWKLFLVRAKEANH